MSADAMPCGCLGHADYEEMCRYPALEAERDEWKRKALERDLEVAALSARAEQAERERDEAQKDVEQRRAMAVQEIAEHRSARKRAEADNAALLEKLRLINEAAISLSEAYGIAGSASAQPHPGAALLARVRALETVRDKFDEWADWIDGEAYGDINKACAAVDALKGKK